MHNCLRTTLELSGTTPRQPPTQWQRFWAWTLQQSRWKEDKLEAAVAFTVFGGRVRPWQWCNPLKHVTGIEGCCGRGPIYRIVHLAVSPISPLLVTFGTLARHVLREHARDCGAVLPSFVEGSGTSPTGARAAAWPRRVPHRAPLSVVPGGAAGPIRVRNTAF